MWLATFFDKKCTVYETSVLTIDWSEVQTKNEIYSLIPCDFGKSSLSTKNLTEDTARDTDTERFELVLNWPWYTNIRKWMFVEVFDDVGVLVSQWVYSIVSIDYVKNWKGIVDNVFIGLNPRDGETY